MEAAVMPKLIDIMQINEYSNVGPSGVVFQGRRVLAWTGTDGQVNVVRVAPGGGEEPPKITQERAIGAPSLFIEGQKLLVSWTGTNHQLNIAEVQF
jgi:hypothetical protein